MGLVENCTFLRITALMIIYTSPKSFLTRSLKIMGLAKSINFPKKEINVRDFTFD